jgi:hypothetical protein
MNLLVGKVAKKKKKIDKSQIQVNQALGQPPKAYL